MNQPTYIPKEVCFSVAKPVFAQGREKEVNLWLSFRAVTHTGNTAILRITGSAAYIIKAGGKFIAFGPARCAHGFYRVDEIDLTSHLSGNTVITIDVAGYNCYSYYHLNQPSFLCAELIEDGVVTTATGSDAPFLCREMHEHEQRVQRYSFQRPFCEVYNLDPSLSEWETETDLKEGAFSLISTAQTEPKAFIARGCEYNTYPEIPAKKIISRSEITLEDHKDSIRYGRHIADVGDLITGFPVEALSTNSLLAARNLTVKNLLQTDESAEKTEILHSGHAVTYQMERDTTGQITMDVTCDEDAELVVIFAEYENENGVIDFRRGGTVNTVIWRLKKGSYHLSTFEPYTFGVMRVIASRGTVSLSHVGVIYFGADNTKKAYLGDDPALAKIYDAAVETYRQNTFTVYMDCPSRERAGWLCDSFFTSRVERILTGKSEIEHNFLENFFLPDSFDALPAGMFPMCYPADHPNGNFIPNWAMWLVLELEEYLKRTGDRAFIDAAKPRIYALLEYFKAFENKDGLLERLKGWVFVEWSKSNELTQDINFPSNMLYARMLRSMAALYEDTSLSEKADKLDKTINDMAFTEDGFYCDNAVYDETGKASLSGIYTESCQYYAFFCGTATPETRPTLWQRLLQDFGPNRVREGMWPNLAHDAKWKNVHPSNAFIGNYLRLELLYRAEEYQTLIENIRGYFIKMAELTGTLWENDTPAASCNHGFASHVIYWMNGMGMIG